MINAGTVLGGRYEVFEKIGTGGMADVYKAKDHKLNRNVAVKVLKDDYSSNKNFVSKFRAEAQAAAGLMHPNIVNVYDVGDEDGLYYFVMELVEGITLKNYIEKKIRLTIKEAISIAIQVSMGIEAAHNNGIIHRDIKPQNVIISKDGKVKVADFGIARAATSDTITTHAMGSVHYTSPEQARGGYSDAKSDIYSIGITLFEMVTGRVPFDGETTVAIAIKHIQEEMPSPKVYVPDIPISVEQIIFKCTQKNPDRRYSNMSELIADLKHSLISPDEDFVVINDANSNAGTKIMTNDKQAVKTAVNKPKDIYESGYRKDNYSPDVRTDVRTDRSYEKRGYDEPPYDGRDSYAPGKSAYSEQDEYYMNQGRNTQGSSRNAGPVYNLDEEDPFDVLAPRDYKKQRQDDYYPDEDDYVRKPAKKPVKKQNSGKTSNNGKKNNKNKSVKKSNYNANDEYISRHDKKLFNDIDDDDDVDPKMEKVISGLLIFAAVLVLVGAILLGYKLLNGGVFGSSGDDTVRVPNVVGMTIEEASKVLADNSLTAKAVKESSDKYPMDIICNQDIEAGTEVEPGTVLNLVISTGIVPSVELESGGVTEDASDAPVGGVTVPDVVGKSEAEAKVAIENEELVMIKEYQESATVEKGTVISQNPLGANTLPAGSAVTIIVSSGTTAVEIEVPNVVGMDEAAAVQTLAAAGLTCNTVKTENSSTVSEGNVISQSVSAGSKVNDNSNVDITVSLGPSGYTCSYLIQSPGDYLAGTEAIITLTDANGAEIQRFSTTSFPYSMVKTGITSGTSGFVTVTYQMTDGQWNTTSPDAVTFTQD